MPQMMFWVKRRLSGAWKDLHSFTSLGLTECPAQGSLVSQLPIANSHRNAWWVCGYFLANGAMVRMPVSVVTLRSLLAIPAATSLLPVP